ncbi:MAG: hypothetical protein E6Q96_01990 [Cyclobacteriaceae bacterium]|nr:MAG: hypothetical protein E6Q96_01990 [Cyclobacteriaceae bacterium]
MSKKVQKRVNGGLAIYYGMGTALGVVAGFIGFIVWIIKVVLGKVEFSWGAAIIIPVILIAMGAMAYSLLRVGYEELED